MMSFISAVVLCFMMGLALVQAQDNPEVYLNPHNAARAAVNVGPLTWDEKLQNYATQYSNQNANNCSLLHSGGPYGENLAVSTRNMFVAQAINLWLDEKSYYDYNSNTCMAGQMCGHYTQMVWSDTIRLGCAWVKCNTGGTFVMCCYDPPGNYIGQRPYRGYGVWDTKCSFGF